MELKGLTDLTLYTVAQVAELFPPEDKRKGKSHVEDVYQLILAHGCYRKFGDAVLLTENDIRALLRAISHNSKASDGSPAKSAEGYIVAVGSRTDPEMQVFMGWAAFGAINSLTRDVAKYAEFRAELLDYKPATYGEFLTVRDQLKPYRYYGHWYARSAGLQTVMNELFATAQEREEDDEI